MNAHYIKDEYILCLENLSLNMQYFIIKSYKWLSRIIQHQCFYGINMKFFIDFKMNFYEYLIRIPDCVLYFKIKSSSLYNTRCQIVFCTLE